MKNVFITYGLNRQWASYRWRAEWPSMYMRDTNLIKIEDAVQYINDFPIAVSYTHLTLPTIYSV